MLKISCRWNHRIYSLCCLASFTLLICKAHSCRKYQNFIFLFFICHILLIHLSFAGPLDCFYYFSLIIMMLWTLICISLYVNLCCQHSWVYIGKWKWYVTQYFSKTSPNATHFMKSFFSPGGNMTYSSPVGASETVRPLVYSGSFPGLSVADAGTLLRMAGDIPPCGSPLPLGQAPPCRIPSLASFLFLLHHGMVSFAQ